MLTDQDKINIIAERPLNPCEHSTPLYCPPLESWGVPFVDGADEQPFTFGRAPTLLAIEPLPRQFVRFRADTPPFGGQYLACNGPVTWLQWHPTARRVHIDDDGMRWKRASWVPPY